MSVKPNVAETAKKPLTDRVYNRCNARRFGPLAHQAVQFLSVENPNMSVLRRVGDWTFSAVVSKTHFLVAELDIVLMRPEEPERW